MSLDSYGKKRDFSKTPEPPPSLKSINAATLRFVIHKHTATHLHYDLRLELDGVLKSWAVPKGPSLDPSIKRLAIMVEDHPLEYINFEGTIPEGNYGAGEVIIWDEGTYTVPQTGTPNETVAAIRDGLTKKKLYIELYGYKLKGIFHLFKVNTKEDNQWFLAKKDDEYSSKYDILLLDKSVKTNLTINELSNRLQINAPLPEQILSILEGVPVKKFSLPILPMLAKLVAESFDRDGWIFEIKWDGYRCIAKKEHGQVELLSRNGNSFTATYAHITSELKMLQFDYILDGELVALNQEGKPDFGLLQRYKRTGEGTIVYYIFDLISLQGHDLRALSLLKRKLILKELIKKSDILAVSEYIEKQGTAFYRIASENGLEGIMAKEESSPYVCGERTSSWLKIKTGLQQEFVIGGYTESKSNRIGFGALITGVYDSGNLIFTGNVGGGFTDAELVETKKMLDALRQNSSPFATFPSKISGPVFWVKPLLVATIKFAEWTSDGIMRQPVFIGFREDRDPLTITKEVAQAEQPSLVKTPPKQSFFQDTRQVPITNTKKIYFPRDGITKGMLLDYYQAVAKWILPHLSQRPESLHRFPNGIDQNHFFHKDLSIAPDWIDTITLTSESTSTKYLIVNSAAALLYMVNLGTIEINPWLSQKGSLDLPDFMIIDLDPLNIPFAAVIETALVFHDLLNKLSIPSYIKTSGASGIHIYIPSGKRYTYDQSRQFIEILCNYVHNQLPSITSLERLPVKRNQKIYLDYLQNKKGKTMAAPYSVRPRDHAPVSTPISWEELKQVISPDQFTISTTVSRLLLLGDLWNPLLEDQGIDMMRCLDTLKKI